MHFPFVQYECRKTLADKRVRVRGRFARNNELCDGDHAVLTKEKNNNNDDNNNNFHEDGGFYNDETVKVLFHSWPLPKILHTIHNHIKSWYMYIIQLHDVVSSVIILLSCFFQIKYDVEDDWLQEAISSLVY